MNTTDDVMLVFNHYKAAMSTVGIAIKMPKNTDITKTYSYRTILSFISKMNEYGLPKTMYPGVINYIVKNAKKKNIVNRGISLLNTEQILKMCYDYLKFEVEKENSIIGDLTRSSKFLFNKDNYCEVLLNKMNRNGYTNLVKWFKSGDLSINFLAVSKCCRKALNKLEKFERDILPSDFKLLKVRIKLLSDREIKDKAVEILGNDLWLSGDMILKD